MARGKCERSSNYKQIKAIIMADKTDKPIAEVETEVNPEETKVTPEGVEVNSEEVADPGLTIIKADKVYTDAIAALKKEKRFRAIVVNVKTSVQDDYVRVTLVLNGPIPGYVLNEDGEYELGMTKNIFTSTYALSGLFKTTDNGKLARFADVLISNPEVGKQLLFGMTIELAQRTVPAGQPVVNPFSSNSEGRIYDHDVLASYIYKMTLGEEGKNIAALLTMGMVGLSGAAATAAMNMFK